MINIGGSQSKVVARNFAEIGSTIRGANHLSQSSRQSFGVPLDQAHQFSAQHAFSFTTEPRQFETETKPRPSPTRILYRNTIYLNKTECRSSRFSVRPESYRSDAQARHVVSRRSVSVLSLL